MWLWIRHLQKVFWGWIQQTRISCEQNSILHNTFWKRRDCLQITLIYTICKLRTESVNLVRAIQLLMHLLTLLIMCEYLQKLISKANYFSVLSDSSTDSAVTEQETIYVIFTCEGTPVLKYLSIENVKNVDAARLKSALEVAFDCFGITPCYDKLVGLNLDGASINMGKINGLNVLVQDEAPWVVVVHCFNHRLELAIKDAFIESTFYLNINEILSKLYWLYQKSPKRLTERIEQSFRKIDTKT